MLGDSYTHSQASLRAWSFILGWAEGPKQGFKVLEMLSHQENLVAYHVEAVNFWIYKSLYQCEIDSRLETAYFP